LHQVLFDLAHLLAEDLPPAMQQLPRIYVSPGSVEKIIPPPPSADYALADNDG
jgi:hypothetical protein